jgi:hypothetical protein
MSKDIEVHISSSVPEADEKIFRSFCEKARRLADTELVSGGGARISAKIRYRRGKGLTFESELPPEPEVAELLMAFRFFHLQKEPTNFYTVIGLIGKHAQDPDSRKVLRVFKKQWRDSLFAECLGVRFNGVPITFSLLLDLWFNAHYFHSDEDKGRELSKLKAGFSGGFAKYMLLDAVFEAVKVVMRVSNVLWGIVDEHSCV